MDSSAIAYIPSQPRSLRQKPRAGGVAGSDDGSVLSCRRTVWSSSAVSTWVELDWRTFKWASSRALVAPFLRQIELARLLLQAGERSQQDRSVGLGSVQEQMDPRPRLAIVARGHLADVRKRFEPGRGSAASRSSSRSVIGAIRSPRRAGLGQVRLEVFGEPLVQPERQVAVRAAEQGVGRLVSQVFLEPRARVRVDDPLVPLCQEEGTPLRQLGIIELEKMDERVLIVEHVDFDRIIVGPRPKIEVLRQVALECLQQRTAGGSSFSGKFENRMKPPVRTW